jgi:cell division protein FtsW
MATSANGTYSRRPSFIVDQSSDEVQGSRRNSDRILLASVLALMIFGVLAVYSSIAFFAELHNTTASRLVLSHIIKLVLAFSIMLIFSKIDYHTVARVSKIGLLISWLFLLIVSFYGIEVFGARRALNIGGFSFQPSSLASLALLVHLCVMLVKRRNNIKSFNEALLPMLGWVGTTCFLIGIEDFSSAAMLLLLSFTMMFIARMSLLHLGFFVICGLIGAVALVGQSAERQSRINNYVQQIIHIESSEFQSGAGYQAQQAQIAIAKGGLLGVGIGKSTQRDFLPAPYNDFIYAIVAEEYGLVGAVLLLLAFVLILIRGVIYIAKNAPDELGTLMAVACTLYIVLYGFVNAAVASGLFPVTGLPIPFISYGGTSMLFSGVMVGILLNISKKKPAGGKN